MEEKSVNKNVNLFSNSKKAQWEFMSALILPDLINLFILIINMIIITTT